MTVPKMKKEFRFEPDWTVPPGETIADLLQEKGWSVWFLSTRLGVDELIAWRIISGKHPIDDRLANLISENLGGSIEFWTRREFLYRRYLRKHAIYARTIGRFIRWLRQSDRIDDLEAENRMLSAFCQHALPPELEKTFLKHCRESREWRKQNG